MKDEERMVVYKWKEFAYLPVTVWDKPFHVVYPQIWYAGGRA